MQYLIHYGVKGMEWDKKKLIKKLNQENERAELDLRKTVPVSPGHRREEQRAVKEANEIDFKNNGYPDDPLSKEVLKSVGEAPESYKPKFTITKNDKGQTVYIDEENFRHTGNLAQATRERWISDHTSFDPKTKTRVLDLQKLNRKYADSFMDNIKKNASELSKNPYNKKVYDKIRRDAIVRKYAGQSFIEARLDKSVRW